MSINTTKRFENIKFKEIFCFYQTKFFISFAVIGMNTLHSDVSFLFWFYDLSNCLIISCYDYDITKFNDEVKLIKSH